MTENDRSHVLDFIRKATAMQVEHPTSITNCDKLDMLQMELKKLNHMEAFMLFAEDIDKRRNAEGCVNFDLIKKIGREAALLYRLIYGIAEPPVPLVVIPWQKCPVCEGYGSIMQQENNMVMPISVTCPTCQGQRKIPMYTTLQ